MRTDLDILFQPVRLAGAEIPNRFYMAPMGNFGCADEQGAPTDTLIHYFEARARGGTGLLFTGFCVVDERIENVKTPSILVIREDPAVFIRQCKKMTRCVHGHGAKIFLQLTAGFGRGARVVPLTKHIAVCDMPNKFDPAIHHRAMTTEEVQLMAASFGRGARIAQECGFDGVEVHAVHEGYLLDQFTMECFNKRTDQYGGCFENRYRVVREIVETIKSACGKDFPVTLRYSVKHFMKAAGVGMLPEEAAYAAEAGRDMEEGILAAKYLYEAGYDALNADVGCYESHYLSHPNIFTPDGLYLPYVRRIQEEAGVPVLTCGRMDDPAAAAQAVKEGGCTMVGLGRPLLADPDYVNKLRTRGPGEIRRCISCNFGCLTTRANTGKVRCAVNPRAYREAETQLVPAPAPKRVTVIGGGPAGLETAATAARRGHKVTLLEREDRLGGNLNTASRILYKGHMAQLIAWYENQLRQLGVTVKTGCAVEPDHLKSLEGDVLVFATGAVPRGLAVPGAAGPRVRYARDVWGHADLLGEKIAVIGAGQIGMETAIWLAREGKTVSVVERGDLIMGGLRCSPSGDISMAKRYIEYYGIDLRLNAALQSIGPDSVTVLEGESVQTLPADDVVLAVGYRSRDSLFRRAKEMMPGREMYLIGDAAQVANVYGAIHHAYELAGRL